MAKNKAPWEKQDRVRIRREYMDCDYYDQLTPEEKAWRLKFDKEYYGANLDVNNLENNIHNTEELKKDCQTRNNHQNWCEYGRAKAKGAVFDATEEQLERDSSFNVEEALVEALDEFLDTEKKSK